MNKSILLILFIIMGNYSFGQTAESLNDATNQFLSTLSQEEIELVSLDFEDTLRTEWTNLPIGLQKRNGIRFGHLSEKSKISFHHLLTTLFSSQGYLKTTSIMALDDVLNEVYKEAYDRKMIPDEVYQEVRALNWDYGNYFIAIWGKPNLKEPWGLKFEGHHISINLSIVKDKVSLTPLFLGTDPAEVTITKYSGLRVLSKEEDYGLLLINSLNEEQKQIATLSQEVPGDIITNPSNKQRIIEYQGIKASELTTKQKDILMMLIKEYINNLEHEKSHKYLSKIEESGIDEIYFAWIGSYEIRKPNYYIINGPNFIIEYDNAGFNNDGNHIHSIWREKGNDFGEDILKTHYLKHKH
ncbi:MAG: DUF3500 domain-containing protein [Melioribacteraceae bacterium]|nr:DUF3500 domain-containing protein [Melioribacteraceae bacterium]MCF8431820.1 DUF3500 domain-containing protein [Melioribacteraceae bacterium]